MELWAENWASFKDTPFIMKAYVDEDIEMLDNSDSVTPGERTTTMLSSVSMI